MLKEKKHINFDKVDFIGCTKCWIYQMFIGIIEHDIK